jgi:hypothetical protein
MRKPDLHDAATALAGENTVKFTTGNNVEFFTEVENPPSQSAIDTKLAELISDWDAQAYARDRATSYPSVGDQLDMMMKDMKNGTTTHQEACEAVKDKYPKP